MVMSLFSDWFCILLFIVCFGVFYSSGSDYIYVRIRMRTYYSYKYIVSIYNRTYFSITIFIL